MARKKKKKIRRYIVVAHMCRRCDFMGEELFEEDAHIDLRNKACPRCHTHMPFPQVQHIEEEVE